VAKPRHDGGLTSKSDYFVPFSIMLSRRFDASRLRFTIPAKSVSLCGFLQILAAEYFRDLFGKNYMEPYNRDDATFVQNQLPIRRSSQARPSRFFIFSPDAGRHIYYVAFMII